MQSESERLPDWEEMFNRLGDLPEIPVGTEPTVVNTHPGEAEFEIINSGIPSLAAALLAWENGNNNPLIGRSIALEQSQVPLFALEFIYDWLKSQQVPHMFLEHSPMIDRQTKQEYLATLTEEAARALGTEGEVVPIRTVTISFSGSDYPRHVLVTSANGGPFIDDQIKKDIASLFNPPLSSKSIKNSSVNSSKFQTAVSIGAASGIIGPFITPAQESAICAVIYRGNDLPANTPVEVSISLGDSLLMSKKDFEAMLADYLSSSETVITKFI